MKSIGNKKAHDFGEQGLNVVNHYEVRQHDKFNTKF